MLNETSKFSGPEMKSGAEAKTVGSNHPAGIRVSSSDIWPTLFHEKAL